MTETEWARCDNPGIMLHFLEGHCGETPARGRTRYLAAVCCERIVFARHRARPGDALGTPGGLVHQLIRRVRDWSPEAQYQPSIPPEQPNPDHNPTPEHFLFDLFHQRVAKEDEKGALRAVLQLDRNDAQGAIRLAALAVADIRSLCPRSWEDVFRAESQVQADLVRCAFGNPFRPGIFAVDWRTATVKALASAACNEGVLPDGTLDPTRLAILADALEDADCSDADLLSHLRRRGPHVRKCWVVDLILCGT
jgi:hypothetical protein